MSDYKEKFEKMKIAGNLASKTLDMLTDEIKAGVSTNKIDKLGYEYIREMVDTQHHYFIGVFQNLYVHH